jgi:hypothetical protein
MKSTMSLEDAVLAKVAGKKRIAVRGTRFERLQQVLPTMEAQSGQGCEVIVISVDESGDREKALDEGARMLAHGGRVLLIEGPDTKSAVRAVELAGWTVHDSTPVDGEHVLLELTRTDESVQS